MVISIELFKSDSRKLQNSVPSQIPETGFEFYGDALLAAAFFGTAIVAAKRCVTFPIILCLASSSVLKFGDTDKHTEFHQVDHMAVQKRQLSPHSTVSFFLLQLFEQYGL